MSEAAAITFPPDVEVSEVKVVQLQPGDILVLRVPRELSMESTECITEILERHLPAGVKCMVLDAGADVSVVRPDEA